MGRPGPQAPAETSAADPGTGGGGRVVQAAGRFRELVAGRPWRRRRRAIIAGASGLVVLLVAAVLVVIFLPALQLREVSVSGLGYVQEDEVRSVLDHDLGDSVLLLPTTDIAERVEAVPGVESAEVHRSWPDGATVAITEAEPVAVLTRTDGTSAVIDGSGQELPADAGEGAELIPLTVDGGSADPEGAESALSEVLASMPDGLRGSVQTMTASSASDVQLVLALEDGGTKTVVWGDAADSTLKAEVVLSLIEQPGTEIDVSSPVAPVTR